MRHEIWINNQPVQFERTAPRCVTVQTGAGHDAKQYQMGQSDSEDWANAEDLAYWLYPLQEDNRVENEYGYTHAPNCEGDDIRQLLMLMRQMAGVAHA
jgi:hypothetical protein